MSRATFNDGGRGGAIYHSRFTIYHLPAMIFRSPFPEVSVPDVPLTEFVFGRAGRLADKPALVDGVSGRVLTYARLVEEIRSTAAGFARRGFRKGDVLALLGPNSPEYAVAFHAAASLGGVVTAINPLYTAEACWWPVS